jgi:hypothetical protein
MYRQGDILIVPLAKMPEGLDPIDQEHSTVQISPGIYQIIRQREYSPEAIRTIAD